MLSLALYDAVIADTVTVGTVPVEADLQIEDEFFYLTSMVYPYNFIDELVSTSNVTTTKKKYNPSWEPEDLTSTSVVTEIIKKRVVRYSTYKHEPADTLQITTKVMDIIKKRVVRYSSFSAPEDELQMTSKVVGIEKTHIPPPGHLYYLQKPDTCEITTVVQGITKTKV